MIPKYGGGGENRTLKKTLQGFQFSVSLRPHKNTGAGGRICTHEGFPIDYKSIPFVYFGTPAL